MKILYNGRVHTMNRTQPVVSGLVIEQGKILAAGDGLELLQRFGDGLPGLPVERVNLAGRAVLPGLTDAHIHLEHYTLSLQKVDVETETRAECLRRVAARAQATPAGKWVLGHGWNQNRWQGGFGSADELDSAAPDHPVYLTAKSLHAAWANHAALKLAGIDAATPDPNDGRIDRDSAGNPTGILFESAMGLVETCIPAPDDVEVSQAIRNAQPVLWRMGLTGAHDFDRRTCFAALQRLDLNNELRLRVVKSLPLDEVAHAAALGLRTGFGGPFLRIGAVKAFADGALGPQTAAMLQPYEGSGDNRGLLMLDGEDLFERGRLAVASGLSLAVHAIGDQANHEVLNGMEHLRQYERSLQPQLERSGARRWLRHRIEHLQVIHADDASRLAALGVIASMQPIHAPSDMQMADRFWGRRAALSYAWRTQLEQGAVLAFGSDAPVESPNPFWGLHAAVTRQRHDGTPGGQGWYPEQRLGLEDALRGFTTGAAYAAGLEDQLGQLAPDFLADLILLEEDPFQVKASDLYQLKPCAAMVAGEWVFADSTTGWLVG